MRVPLQTRYRKFAERGGRRAATGFATPTRKIELYSETLLDHGYPPLPEYEEPLVGPVSRPDLAERFPLILTCAKHTLFCETQHRALPSLRRHAPDPEVELHPAAAAERGIGAGDWVRIETPAGQCAGARQAERHAGSQSGRAASTAGGRPARSWALPGYDPFSPDGANLQPPDRQRGDRPDQRLGPAPRLPLPGQPRGVRAGASAGVRPAAEREQS